MIEIGDATFSALGADTMRHTADFKQRSNTETGPGEGRSGGEALVPRTDMLVYVADMIGELHDMSRRLECETLAGILDLAHNEARQQVKRNAP